MDPSGDTSHRYRALFQVARAINSTLEEEACLALVARSVTEAVGSKGCALRLLSDRATLDLVASYGLSDEYLGKGFLRPEAASATERALSGHAVVAHIEDPEAWQYAEEARREGIATSLTVPLLIAGRPIGILRLYAAETREFGTDEVEFVSALADLSALAIRNAQLHRMLERERDLIKEYAFGPAAPR